MSNFLLLSIDCSLGISLLSLMEFLFFQWASFLQFLQTSKYIPTLWSTHLLHILYVRNVCLLIDKCKYIYIAESKTARSYGLGHIVLFWKMSMNHHITTDSPANTLKLEEDILMLQSVPLSSAPFWCFWLCLPMIITENVCMYEVTGGDWDKRSNKTSSLSPYIRVKCVESLRRSPLHQDHKFLPFCFLRCKCAPLSHSCVTSLATIGHDLHAGWVEPSCRLRLQSQRKMLH